MPITRFQLPMSKNYDFTRIKDYLWTDVVGCLTPSVDTQGVLETPPSFCDSLETIYIASSRGRTF